MTAGQLKKILERVDDESPIVINDVLCLDEMPIYEAWVTPRGRLRLTVITK